MNNTKKTEYEVGNSEPLVVSDHRRMRDMPLGERPYEKCLVEGVGALNDEELLSVIFRSGTCKKRITEVSRAIMNLCEEYGGLGYLNRIPISSLMEIEGVGKVRAIQLLCIGELSKRISKSQKTNTISSIRSAGDVYDYFSDSLKGLEVEENWVLLLDGKNNIIKRELMTRGTANSSILPVREILKLALRNGAVGIVIVHNHPSGDPQPSEADIEVTRQFHKACRITDIELVDHIVIGDQRYVSMKFEGYM